ncbi:MAG: GyrI-like domain-containing protein [Ferruginibacter sp.]|nr:GyrI-like domain-containing protein [Ferruginibacter sp.]
MKENTCLIPGLIITAILFVTGCNDNQSEKKITEDSTKTTRASEPVAETKRGPVINIGDTVSLKQVVITMKDSAATMQGVSTKLGEIYGVKLAAIIKKNNLQITGAPVAWYKGRQAPYFFEAGIPVNKKPAKLPAGTYIKQIGIDSIVVAHFYGPYDLIPQAYDALTEWLKDHKKKVKGVPYEVYISDPLDEAGKPKDPYKVQTDIVFAWK